MKNKTGRNSYSFNFKSTLQKKMPVRIPLSLSLYQRYVEVSEEVGVDRRSVERWYKKYVRDYFKLTHAKKMQRAKGGGRKLKYPEMDGSLKFHFYYY